MTDISELLEEALWSLEKESDVANAATALAVALELLGDRESVSAETFPAKKKRRKSTSSTRKKKKKKKTVEDISFRVNGKLPPRMSVDRLTSGIIPVLDDCEGRGKYIYLGYNTMNNGTRCFNLMGWCPVHKRDHETATLQFKQHSKSEWCVIKCWRDDTILKIRSIPELLY